MWDSIGHSSKGGTSAKQLTKSENEESEEKDLEDNSIMHILEYIAQEEQKMFWGDGFLTALEDSALVLLYSFSVCSWYWVYY